MSSTTPNIPSAVGEFQMHFGAAPGSQDPKAECEKWQCLCDELLAEREQLRTALEKERLDRFWNEFTPTLTMEQVYAQVDRATTLEQIIADLKKELEPQK